MKEELKLELEALKYAASMGYGSILREMKTTPFTIKESLAQPEHEQALLDAIVGGTGVMLGDKRIDPASIYKQRPWVGLTDVKRDEILDIYLTAEGRARAIEAELKELNT